MGVVLLDSITFSKIIPSSKYAVAVLVCNKREIGEYATDSIRSDYFDFARKGDFEGNAEENVLFAQVIVNGAHNMKLAETIGVPKGFQHPQLFLYKPNSETPIPYPQKDPFQATALTSFLSKHTSFFYGIPGLVAVFEKYSDVFVLSSDFEKEDMLREAENSINTILNDNNNVKDKENGKYYIKIMKNIIKTGNKYVLEEMKRLQKIIDSEKVSAAKKVDVQRRLNILTQFERSESSKDEL